MPKSGSVIGISGGWTINLIGAPPDFPRVEVRINGTIVLTATARGLGSQTTSTIQGLGIDTFVAGDVLSLFFDGGNATYSTPYAAAEVAFDT